MRPTFYPCLVNPPQEDPGLYISNAYRGAAMLFDAGDLGSLSNRELLKVEHLFITHTHMDHFSGFDRLLRLLLGRNKTLHLYGPEGFIDNLNYKLNSYSWNLVNNFNYPMVIKALEHTVDRRKWCTFECRDGFKPSRFKTIGTKDDILLSTPALTVKAAILDHQISCLGLVLKESFHVNIMKPAMSRLGLLPGPWLKILKRFLYQNQPDDLIFEVPRQYVRSTENRFQLGGLADKIAKITPGQQIAYITDVGFTPANIARIQQLVHGADHLFIEAAFLDKDRHVATAKSHLTARQAGYLAAVSLVKKMTVFHFSPRYENDFSRLGEEAQASFDYYRQNQLAQPP